MCRVRRALTHAPAARAQIARHVASMRRSQAVLRGTPGDDTRASIMQAVQARLDKWLAPRVERAVSEGSTGPSRPSRLASPARPRAACPLACAQSNSGSWPTHTSS